MNMTLSTHIHTQLTVIVLKVHSPDGVITGIQVCVNCCVTDQHVKLLPVYYITTNYITMNTGSPALTDLFSLRI